MCRSSAIPHMKSERHTRSVTIKQQRADIAAKDDERWKATTSETEKLFSGGGFVPMDAVPSIRVTKNEPRTVSSQLQIDQEEGMMRRVLKHLNTPEKDDRASCPIHSWQLADQSLEAQVAQVVAGNLAAIGPDTGDDDVLANVINAACSWILPPSPQPRVIYSAPLQPHRCLLTRLNTSRLESRSQTRERNGIHIRAKRFVSLSKRLAKPLTCAWKDVPTRYTGQHATHASL